MKVSTKATGCLRLSSNWHTDTAGFIDLVVKKYPDGPMSEHLHSMKPDQRLDFKGPIPKYPWSPNKHDHICLLAGGTGITPMYQLARAIFKNPEDKTKVTLVFGNLTEEDILLKHEWAELENQYPQRFRAFYVLDNPPETWQQGKGHINKDLLKTVLPEPKAENVSVDSTTALTGQTADCLTDQDFCVWPAWTIQSHQRGQEESDGPGRTRRHFEGTGLLEGPGVQVLEEFIGPKFPHHW